MRTSTASVRTAHGSRYLQQLSKHWGHRCPVEFTPTDSTIELPLGKCVMHADAERLDIQLTGPEDTDFDHFEKVVADHLQRFGHRETLEFDWRRG